MATEKEVVESITHIVNPATGTFFTELEARRKMRNAMQKRLLDSKRRQRYPRSK